MPDSPRERKQSLPVVAPPLLVVHLVRCRGNVHLCRGFRPLLLNTAGIHDPELQTGLDVHDVGAILDYLGEQLGVPGLHDPSREFLIRNENMPQLVTWRGALLPGGGRASLRRDSSDGSSDVTPRATPPAASSV